MRKIVLHGLMGKTFGKCFELEVISIADATRALGAQLKGFRQFINDHDFRIIVGKAPNNGLQLGEKQIDMRLPKGDLHYVPVVKGAKRGGIVKIIAGVLLAAFAWWAAPVAALGGLGAGIGIGGLTYGNIAMIGLAVALSGVSQMLSQTPKDNNNTAKDDSFMIDGATNTTEQGGAIPLLYGRCLVGSTMISAGITTADIPVGS